MNRLPLALVAGIAASVFAMVPDPVTGCAVAPHHGEDTYTTDEAALIVWDAKTKTEHFVRRANFRSTGYDFGFLVPTPTPPVLDVADDKLFTELSQLTAAKVEYREETKEVAREFPFMPGCAMNSEFYPASKDEAPALAGGVDVLEQKRVGDYDAAVLVFRKGGATPEHGAEELAKWLAKHGYEAPPAIEKWLAKYVKDEWCITAFKIALPEPKKSEPNAAPKSPTTRNDLRLRPVRMSFKTEKPFYPYREPETEQTKQTSEPRTLRVFVAASGRYGGKLGDDKPWPGKTVWANAVAAPSWEILFKQAKLTDPPMKGDKPAFEAPPTEGLWLTEFEDTSLPRPGTDEVYFEPSADTSTLERPPIIVTNTKYVMVTPWWQAVVYICISVGLLLAGFGTWRLLRRK